MNQDKLVPWGPEKKQKWFLNQRIQRSYQEDVLNRLDVLRKSAPPLLSVERYGNLSINPEKYPLYVVRVGDRSPTKPTILISGGVHGYETSGVKGALLFLEKHVENYVDHCNFVVPVCISPWSYETINRLNPNMENPNRQFKDDSKAEECILLINYINQLGVQFQMHIDLHETTDSDQVFIPEEYAKNGLKMDAKDVDIPDGFYLIGCTGYVNPELERAMIESVRKVTHIAEPDERGQILDVPLSSDGVVHITTLGHCSEYTDACTRWGAYITEMYPDSPRFKSLSRSQVEDLCSEAQVACVRGALDYCINRV